MKQLNLKSLAFTLGILASSTAAHAAFNLVPNGDFSIPGGANWGSFASPGAVVSYPSTGGNTGGYGKVDNTAGVWGAGLVSPTDTAYPGGTGIPLAALGLLAGQTYTFKMDMINLSGTGRGGVKFESWAAGIISNSGDVPASGQSTSWATYSWTYTIAPTATSIKIVPLITNPTLSGGNILSSIGFDNVGVEGALIPEPSSSLLAGLGALALLGYRRRM